jgi:arabinofuranosyltransferase
MTPNPDCDPAPRDGLFGAGTPNSDALHPSPFPRAIRLLTILLLALGALHAVVHMSPFEDAFITYRYAEHVASGFGFVYNLGERVEGCSSLSWTVLLAAVAKLGLPLVPISQFLSILGGLFLALTTLGMSRTCITRHAFDGWQLLPVAGIVASGTWAYYSGSGMETTTFAALITAAVRLAITERDGRSSLFAGLLFGLAATTRPEGVAYVAAVAIALLWGESRRDGLKLSLGFLVLYAPFSVARYWYFGFPFPNTYYAKAAPSLSLFKAGLVHAEAFLTSQAFWLPFAAAVGLGLVRRHQRVWRVLAAVVLAAVLNAIVVGGDTFAYFRLFLPAMPCAAVALVATARAANARWHTRRVVLASAGLIAVWVAYTFAAQFLPTRTLLSLRPQSEWSRVAAVERMNADYFEVGEWLHKNLDPNTLLAVNAAGIVPYVSGLRTLDMLGLNDVHIAHHHQTLGLGVIGHEKHDAKYVLSRQPDIILLGLPVLSSRRLTPSEFEPWFARWFPFLPGDRKLFYSENFRHMYTPVSVAVGNRYLAFFLRNEPARAP